MNAKEKLRNKTSEGLHICLGLDPDIAKIPRLLMTESRPVLKFNSEIISATKGAVAAYKLNLAFFENRGLEGLRDMEDTLSLIPKDVMVIADAKRGDIGNSSQKYAESIFEHYGFDSVTLNPYMGLDSLAPFISYEDRISYVLALTSNPGSVDFEKLRLSDGRALFQLVLEKIKEWNQCRNLGCVFGATNSVELKENVSLLKGLKVLLPGVGTQGGKIEDIVPLFKMHELEDYLINISRALIYASQGLDFAEKCAEATLLQNQQIQGI